MPSRREMLVDSAALATGAAMLDEAVGAQNNPAAQVADRSSSIRITGLQATLVSPSV